MSHVAKLNQWENRLLHYSTNWYFSSSFFGFGHSKSLSYYTRIPTSFVWLHKANRTTFTMSTCYSVEFPTIHPVPFQLLVSEVAPDKFSIQAVYYGGATFDSLQELVMKYTQGVIRKIRRTPPSVDPTHGSIPGSMNLRGDTFPNVPHAPPKQYEPQGPRYSVENQHVRRVDCTHSRWIVSAWIYKNYIYIQVRGICVQTCPFRFTESSALGSVSATDIETRLTTKRNEGMRNPKHRLLTFMASAHKTMDYFSYSS